MRVLQNIQIGERDTYKGKSKSLFLPLNSAFSWQLLMRLNSSRKSSKVYAFSSVSVSLYS